MIIDKFKHKRTNYVIVIVEGVIVITSKEVTLRVGTQGDDGEVCAALRTLPVDQIVDLITPKVGREFDGDAWMLWCEENKVDDGEAYDLRDVAQRDGQDAWVRHVDGVNAPAKLRARAKDEASRFWVWPEAVSSSVSALKSWAETREPPKKLTIEQVAHAAWRAQDASNLSGLVLSWAEWMPVINAHAREKGIKQNEHEINVMMLDKLCQLAGIEQLNNLHVHAAYKVVHHLAGLPD